MKNIPNLIAGGKVREALDQLMEASKNVDIDIYNQVIILSGIYENYKKEKRLGLNETTTDLRKVESAVLELNQRLVQYKQPSALKKWLVWPVVFAVLFLAGWYFLTHHFSSSPVDNSLSIVVDTAAVSDHLTTDSIDNQKNIIKKKPKPFGSLPQKNTDSTAVKASNREEPIPKTSETVQNEPAVQDEHIIFQLIMNAPKSDIEIYIDDKQAEIVRDAPTVKWIRVVKRDYIRRIEIFDQDKKKVCSKNIIIIENQPIVLPCVN